MPPSFYRHSPNREEGKSEAPLRRSFHRDSLDGVERVKVFRRGEASFPVSSLIYRFQAMLCGVFERGFAPLKKIFPFPNKGRGQGIGCFQLN
jgi:hypothetical protein